MALPAASGDFFRNDQLNRFLMVLVMISLLISLFGVRPFYLVGIAILVWSYSRMFSGNIYKRQAENSVYLRYEYKVRQKFAGWKKAAKQRKTHHIYKCPSCKQKIRIPSVKGKIEIRCPKCGQTFIRRS